MKSSGIKKIIVILIIFFISFSVRLWTLNQMGRTWDEQGWAEEGYRFFQLAKKGDFTNKYWYQFPDHPPLAKYLYGIAASYDNPRIVNNDVVFNYDITHARLVSIFFGSFAAVIILLIGWRYLTFFSGLTASLIFALLPLSIGYTQLVTLESPRLFFYAATVYAFLLFLEKPSYLRSLVTGILLGCAFGVKQSGILLYPLLFWITILWAKNIQDKSKKRIKNLHQKTDRLFLFKMLRANLADFIVFAKSSNDIYSVFRKVIFIFIISFFTFFLLWPMPWFHPAYVYNYSHTVWITQVNNKGVPEVFFGGLHLTPRFYYIVYFILTTPVFILVLFLTGLLRIDKEKDWIKYSLVAIFLMPFFMSFIAYQQHNIRYIIEIYIGLSLISALGLEWILKALGRKLRLNGLRWIGLLALVIYLFFILLLIKPYYLDYFNGFVGGVKNVYDKKLFQIGWWGQGLGEAGKYVLLHAPKGSTVGLAVSPSISVPPLPGLRVQKYLPGEKYDYVIVNNYDVLRERFDDSAIRENYKLIHTIGPDGAVLVWIYKK